MFRIVASLTCGLVLAACQTQAPSDVVYPSAATPARPAPLVQSSAADTGPDVASPPQSSPAQRTSSLGVQVAAADDSVPAAKPRPQRQQPAGRATRAPEPAAEEPKRDDGPMTITKAREQCWMLSENEKSVRTDLDKKVKWVEQCVDKRMNASIGR